MNREEMSGGDLKGATGSEGKGQVPTHHGGMRSPAAPPKAKCASEGLADASIAAKTLREHLDSLSLGGDHPVMVVVPRTELEAVLDGYRRYLAQAFRSRVGV